ncbi:MAG TPA: hypothetical protein VLA56_08860 [Pseudomonadales bacterium]|nr:hypothetical protein [Pseudomonadales bacterium]
MNWDAISAVGEILGSVAVFITLGYLALQVRHARAETGRALSQGRMEANREVLKLDLEERHLAARIKAEAAFAVTPPRVVVELMEKTSLTLEEAWHVFLVEVARWNYRTHVIVHWDALPESERDLFDHAVRIRMASGLSLWMYEMHFRPGANKEVLTYMDRVLG